MLSIVTAIPSNPSCNVAFEFWLSLEIALKDSMIKEGRGGSRVCQRRRARGRVNITTEGGGYRGAYQY
jgi:hypothetical protein